MLQFGHLLKESTLVQFSYSERPHNLDSVKGTGRVTETNPRVLRRRLRYLYRRNSPILSFIGEWREVRDLSFVSKKRREEIAEWRKIDQWENLRIALLGLVAPFSLRVLCTVYLTLVCFLPSLSPSLLLVLSLHISSTPFVLRSYLSVIYSISCCVM